VQTSYSLLEFPWLFSSPVWCEDRFKRQHAQNTHTNAQTHTQKHAQTHTQKHAQTHTQKHAQTHTQKHAQTHTQKHAQTHTHTLSIYLRNNKTRQVFSTI